MKFLFIFFACFIGSYSFSQTYSRVAIHASEAELIMLNNLGVALDNGFKKDDGYFVTELSSHDLQKISQNNISYEVLIPNVSEFYVQQNLNQIAQTRNTTCSGLVEETAPVVPDNFTIPSTYGGYLKYDELLAELDEMASLYPHLISAKAPISTFLTWENRPIYQVKISNNPSTDDGDPMVMYSALHHAREPMSMMQLVYYMWYLLENYDSNPEVKFLVDHTQMIFVPCLNPDGYIHNQVTDPNGGGMHRKNRNPSIGTSNKGVDLNRNYGYGWGTTGVSNNQNDDTYPGTSAFSEPETQAMRWLVQNQPIRAALNAHTYGDMLLFPIGTTSSEYAQHHDYFVALTDHLTQYNGYEASKSSGLYPASGDSDDYMYKVDNGVLEKDTIFAMTPEIGGSFWPASSQIIPTCQEMLFVNLGLAHMVHAYYIVENLDETPIALATGDFNYSIKRLGRADGSATVSVEPLLNIQTVGSANAHNLNVTESENHTISYTLVPTIENGDEVKYILVTTHEDWIERDTITRIYGNATGMDTTFVDQGQNVVNWTGNWGTTTSTYYSPTRSITDSPTGNYSNNVTRPFTLNNAIDLTNMESAKVTFYAKWSVEKDYDFCQFQVSTDDGTTWIPQCGLYTTIATEDEGVQVIGEPKWDGVKSEWVKEEINLSEYLGETIRCRFLLKSDGGVRNDGFYFDDFTILMKEIEEEEPEPGIGVENSEVTPFKVFPNPTNEMLNIVGELTDAQIELIDLRGMVVQTIAVSHSTNTQINVSNLVVGTYFLKIHGKENYIQKIIIQ